jgi:hypothetical protein
MAWAALPSTRREMRLRPAMSVTEYIIAMSEPPDVLADVPEATVDTITFGTPIGKARMCRRDQGSSARAADAEQRAHVALCRHVAFEGQRHRSDRAPAIAGEHGRAALRVVCRHVLGRSGAEVNRHDGHAGAPQPLADECRFLPLRIVRGRQSRCGVSSEFPLGPVGRRRRHTPEAVTDSLSAVESVPPLHHHWLGRRHALDR